MQLTKRSPLVNHRYQNRIYTDTLTRLGTIGWIANCNKNVKNSKCTQKKMQFFFFHQFESIATNSRKNKSFFSWFVMPLQKQKICIVFKFGSNEEVRGITFLNKYLKQKVLICTYSISKIIHILSFFTFLNIRCILMNTAKYYYLYNWNVLIDNTNQINGTSDISERLFVNSNTYHIKRHKEKLVSQIKNENLCLEDFYETLNHLNGDFYFKTHVNKG